MKKDSYSVCILRSNPVCPDSRVEKEALTLYKAGYNVHIFAWDRGDDHPEKTELLMDGAGILVTRVGFKASYGEGFKNLLPYLKFQFSIIRYIIKNKKNFDIIHACDFDTAFSSSLITKLLGKRFIFDIFDFICGDAKTLYEKVIKHLQLMLINLADATIICTEDRKKQIFGSQPKSLYVIHNSPPEFSPVEETRLKENATPSVVYVGILQDYRLLLEIGDYFCKHPEISFHIGGFGKYEDHFKTLSSQYPNIKFYGKLPYEETLKLEASSDIMVAIYDPTLENHLYAAPNKFYEALMLGKPLIMVDGTGMSNELRQNHFGELIDYSQNGFGEGLQRLLNRRDEWGTMCSQMKKLYKDKYSWSEMESRLISLYNYLQL